jgi:serine/threonine-protein kinase
MTGETRIRELLEQILESGSAPEEACAQSPELLFAVQQQLQRLRSVENQLEELFPSSCPISGDGTGFQSRSSVSELPQIDGYDVESVLAYGGMGVVYRARHLKLKRTVALKMLLSGTYASRQELARFVREAEAVAGLEHPHIVQVHDVGDLKGRPFFTMEFIEGGSLAHALAGVPQAALHSAQLVTTLAVAVEFAHRHGVVHRDLKPANILLTVEGTPKIADFGLARQLDAGPELTRSGTRVGTPSYMAPEQALGKSGTIGPAVDVYALGAILYEMLTGRPPFRAETAAETERQVIGEEPVPPVRLNSKVPRDLETICLKCLSKDPESRYSSAAALADDLRRFADGRPILARPLSWEGRAWRWARRNPAAAALVVTALALIGLALGGGLWQLEQQAERRAERARQEGRAGQALQAALEQALAFRKQGRWHEMRATLEGAASRSDTEVPADLRERLDEARADADMVLRLEEVRLRLSEGRSDQGEHSFSADEAYAEAFRNYGIVLSSSEPAEATARIHGSAIRETLLAFLYDWLHWVSDVNRDQLRALLDQADDDEWRREFCEALAAKDEWKLNAVARADGAMAQPPVIISGLAGTLLDGPHRLQALALLREAQEQHPEDFWINFLLGLYWSQESAQEAVGYCRAAVAIRPNSDQAYVLLGRALRAQGNTVGASAAFRKALALNPNSPVGKDLASAVDRRSALEEARTAWEKLVTRDPSSHDAWYGYAELCLYLGNTKAYRWARERLLERFGETENDWITAERTSMACLLLPASGDELRRAAELADRALSAADKSRDAGNPYVPFVKGMAEYRQGRHTEAIPWLMDSATRLPNRPGPRLALAMAQFESGSPEEARKTLAVAVRDYDWNESSPATRTDPPVVWVSHVLRRQAEAMILPNLPAFLRGEYEPQDNDERLALLGVCQSEGRCSAAARLYADAFAADPNLADDLTAECLRRTRAPEHPDNPINVFNAACRYHAARCAALAGGGFGRDVPQLNDADRTRWRRQAREWLQADLSAWGRLLESDSEVARDLAKRMLEHWQVDPNLAGLREPGALEALRSEERKECLSLWNDVAAGLSRAQATK